MQDKMVVWTMVEAEEMERSDWIWDRLWKFSQVAPGGRGSTGKDDLALAPGQKEVH